MHGVDSFAEQQRSGLVVCSRCAVSGQTRLLAWGGCAAPADALSTSWAEQFCAFVCVVVLREPVNRCAAQGALRLPTSLYARLSLAAVVAAGHVLVFSLGVMGLDVTV